MSEMKDVPKITAMPAAALRPELAERFLAAMQAASAEEGRNGLEYRLRNLRPAPVGEERSRTWLTSMQGIAASRFSLAAWRRFSRWGAAAALFVLCSSVSLLLVGGGIAADEPSSLVCRSVIDSREEEAVQWQEGQVALLPCEVLYEDSFVLDGDDDCTITVRVPVRSRVLLEEEVI